MKSITTKYYHLHVGNTELLFAISSGAFWFAGLVFSFMENVDARLSTSLFILSAILGGYFTFLTAGKDLLNGKLCNEKSKEIYCCFIGLGTSYRFGQS